MSASFWALIALVLFLLILVYFKAPAFLAGLLDERAQRIRDDLEHARRLREEAVQLLEEYKKKCLEAEKQAKDLIAAAKLEVQKITQDAEKANKEYIAQRNRMAVAQIAQAEEQAKRQLQDAIVNLSVQATQKVLEQEVDDQFEQKVLQETIKDLKHFSY